MKAVPKIPAPRAPKDCSFAKNVPVLAKPIIEWIHAANDPAPTPPVVNPSPPKKLELPNPAALAEANKLANALYPSTL